MFGGRPRKLVLTAARNGYFFVVDRVTGEHLLTSKFSESANWATGLNDKGQPVRNPAKDHHIGGALVSAANQGSANWPPPAFSPDTGLFYVPTADTYAMYYLTEPDPRGALGLGGKDERPVGTAGSYLTAIDYKTGKMAWRRQYRTHLARRARHRAADDGRATALCGRRLGQLRRVRSGQRHAAVAHAARPGDVERAGNLHGGRQAARARGGRRHALRLCAVLGDNPCRRDATS